ncbi:DUF1295 domain-containing protein [Methylophilaceae bacterium]|nr:DUF1295 domain-containing protein [Methylophilaceae bacterium]
MISIYLPILTNLIIFALAGWVVSLATKNVTHVDSMWSIFFVLAMATGMFQLSTITDKHVAIMIVLLIWASRLSIYLTLRNWGQPEDIRYQHIRENNSPGFHIKSLYIIFLLQALLAAIIVLPLISSLLNTQPYNSIDIIGLGIVLFGILFQTIADIQLKHFLSKDKDKGILDKGLWKYSRHPNYFGECLIWWGFYITSQGSGPWFTILSPILMTVLLLKVSGVGLMEQTITSRRPGYTEYIKKTSSFIPWPPKN